jgi:putative endonuclease
LRNSSERRARNHYALRFYRILDTNVWSGGYELDLVARRGNTLVFVEVKGKGGAGFGDPLEMVTAEKVRRIVRAADAWLHANPAHARCAQRFDVVVDRAGRLERVTDAFSRSSAAFR